MITGKEPFLVGVCTKADSIESEVSSLQFDFEVTKEVCKGREEEITIDFFERNVITEKYYIRAQEDISKYDIDFSLGSVENELFLMKNKNHNYSWEIL